MDIISVIIPFYKISTDYMKQCMDSLLNQTYTNLEIIMVDDGSPDDCGKRCDVYARLDKRIKVVHKANGGLSDARNAGISVATGQWVTFVDGDDWVELDFLQHFIDRISSQQIVADVYFYSGYRNYPSKEVMGVPHFQDGQRFISYQEREQLQMKCCTIHLEKSGNRKGITISSAWAKVYRTDFLKKNNLQFPIIPYDEDSIFYLYELEAAQCVEYVAKPVYHYRYTDNSIVNRYRPAAIKEQEIYLQHMFNFAEDNNKSEVFRKAIYMRVMTSMLLLLKLKFYNTQNKCGRLQKWKECESCFQSAPYKDMYKNVSLSLLGKNAKIKYMLLWCKCYGIVEWLRAWNTKRMTE